MQHIIFVVNIHIHIQISFTPTTTNPTETTISPSENPSNNPSINPTTHIPTTNPTPVTSSPTNIPTFSLIGSHSTANDLFVITDITMTYEDAKQYCNTRYYGIANIYDPKENDIILQLVNLNFITHAFIGYYKYSSLNSEWKWESNVSSNPLLWLNSPLAQITSNIQYPNTNCMVTSRYGWQYTQCKNSYYFVCETRYHSPEFIESGPFMMSKRKLTYNYARSLCRSQYYDLATIYEEDEYKIAQSLCANNTLNKTNCYIGYEKGILNEDEWMWVQNIPISAIPINELVNTDLWSIFPWQLSTADIYCQATTNVTISYASNGQNYGTNVSEEFRINEAIKLKATNVLYDSTILFTVTTKKGALPGLKCSIHFEEDIYSTQENGYVYWNVDTYINNIPHDDSDPYEILEAYSTVDRDQTAPVTIANDAQWIWNYVYENKSYVTDYDSITFKFSFEHVKNVQNKPGDNCASISYYPPNKWKTDNCENEMYFICNAYDHKPIFKITQDNKFAVLTDRQLTYDQSAAICNVES
eukprot:892157_1